MSNDADNLVAIRWPRDEWEATAICDALDEQGIPCNFAGRSLMGSGEFHFGAIPSRRLYVRQQDAERAVAFIKGHDWPSYTPHDDVR